MDKPAVLVVGDIMLDRYVVGPVRRISPEAPVPVVLAEREYAMLGGASNVANNLRGLNVPCSLFGSLGNDDAAKEIRTLLSQRAIRDWTFQGAGQTTVKTRIVSGNQQIVRVDRESHFDNSAEAMARFAGILPTFNGSMIIVSDYDKGLCSEDLVRQLITNARSENKRVFIDPKGLNWQKYRGGFLLKPNVKEVSEVLGRHIENSDSDIERAGHDILRTYDVEYILITRSEQGMTLMSQNTTKHIRSEAKRVFDVSGAGDTVIAALVYALHAGRSLTDACALAIRAADVVIAKAGVRIVTESEL